MDSPCHPCITTTHASYSFLYWNFCWYKYMYVYLHTHTHIYIYIDLDLYEYSKHIYIYTCTCLYIVRSSKKPAAVKSCKTFAWLHSLPTIGRPQASWQSLARVALCHWAALKVKGFVFVLPNLPLNDAMTQSGFLSSEEDSKCCSGSAFAVWWFMASKGSLPQTLVSWWVCFSALLHVVRMRDPALSFSNLRFWQAKKLDARWCIGELSTIKKYEKWFKIDVDRILIARVITSPSLSLKDEAAVCLLGCQAMSRPLQVFWGRWELGQLEQHWQLLGAQDSDATDFTYV